MTKNGENMKIHLNISNFISILIGILIVFSVFGCHDEILTNQEEDVEFQANLKLNSFRNPRARVQWEPGSTYTIKWQPTENVDKVSIELLRKFNLKYIISSSTNDDGQFTWTIPTTLEQSHHYRIKLVDVNYINIFINSVEFEIINKGSPDVGN